VLKKMWFLIRKLFLCIYGEGSHFVTIVRDFSNNRLLYCDGMENNAQFVDFGRTISCNDFEEDNGDSILFTCVLSMQTLLLSNN
jgi:hypothetical protein